MHRRKLLTLGLALSANPASATEPTQAAMRLLVGGPPGSLSDALGRVVAERLARDISSPVIVENRVGANSSIMARLVASTTAPESSLMLASDGVILTNHVIYRDVGYDAKKDFRPLALVGRANLLLVVSQSLPANTVQELAQLSTRPTSRLFFASGGVGHPVHVLMELVCSRLGMTMVHVPYQGTIPAVLSIAKGETSAMIVGLVEAAPLIEYGSIRPLAVIGPLARARFPQLPEIRTLHPDLSLGVWFGLFASARMTVSTARRLSVAVVSGLNDSSIRQRVEEVGVSLDPLGMEAFQRVIDSDGPRYQRVVEELGIKS